MNEGKNQGGEEGRRERRKDIKKGGVERIRAKRGEEGKKE